MPKDSLEEQRQEHILRTFMILVLRLMSTYLALGQLQNKRQLNLNGP